MAGILQSNETCYILGCVAMIFGFIYQVLGTIVSPFVPRRLRFRRKDITGQKILITGAGNGVGRELAVQFSKHATCLILVDLDEQSLLHTRKLLDGRSTVFTYECDVSDYKKVCELAEKVKKDAGDVDILVNNAGVISGQYLQDIPEYKIRRTMGVNVLAHFWTVIAFLSAMRERNSGHVVSIASIAGKVGCPKAVDYCSSKYAAVGFAESLEMELREQKLDGIKITIVCPFFINTGFFSGINLRMGTIMSPKCAAKEIVLGVLEEQALIYLPPFMKFLPILKECFPRWLILKYTEFTGDLKMLENVTVRPMKDASNGLQKEDVDSNILKT